MELMRVVSERPHLAEVMTVLLYETFGPTLGAGNENAASLFGIALNFARRYPESLRRAGFSERRSRHWQRAVRCDSEKSFGSRDERRSL